jgi:DNA-binding response OmpR family regulator
MRVLVVEDQTVVADRIAEGLRDEGMAVDVAYDGSAAIEAVTSPWSCPDPARRLSFVRWRRAVPP